MDNITRLGFILFLRYTKSKQSTLNALLLLFQVYWIGPVSGSVVAALLYMFVFAAPQVSTEEDHSNGDIEFRLANTGNKN